uniref:Uncharacterized protein n=1 Tax=Lepeophtheirus salmonis TaxID=72036 RepID=A0A0K2UKW8_LEPSM
MGKKCSSANRCILL